MIYPNSRHTGSRRNQMGLENKSAYSAVAGKIAFLCDDGRHATHSVARSNVCRIGLSVK